VDDRPVQLGYRQRELITRLALGPESGLDRKQIASDLWPEIDSAKADFYLRRLLSQLRRALGPSNYILEATVRGSLSLRHVDCDVRGFWSAVTSENEVQLRHAVELFKGSPLPSSNALWLSPFRERTTSLLVSALDRLAQILAARSECRKAATLLRIAVDVAPASESLRCRLMKMLAEGGDGPAALAEYERYREYLESHLSLRPSSAAISLASSIRTAARRPRAKQDTAELQLTAALPHPATPLIGRADLVAKLAKAVNNSPLVTLTGPGGVGKTRLAIAAAEEISGKFKDGVWFCDLSSTTSAEHLWHTIATSLRAEPSADAQTSVLQLLRATKTLVILDNCEHLIEAVACAAETILIQAPTVLLLATSREPLNVSGERIMTIPPLDPTSDGVDLFFEAAARANNVLQRDSESGAVVADICNLVDGLPLGIEIAASHLRLVSLARLREIVSSRASQLRLRRGRTQRQLTLAATVEWSYQLLPAREQRCLRVCGLAHGSIHIDALSHILGSSREDVEQSILALKDRSLVQAFDGHRISLLETFRQYAVGLLEENGELDYAWDHYICWLRSVGHMSQEPRSNLSAELPMVQAALDWCRGAPERADLGLILIISINRTWGLFASRSEAIEQLRGFLEYARRPDLAAASHQVIGTYLHDIGDFDGAELSLEAGLEALDSAPSPVISASLNCLRGTLHLSRGDLVLAKSSFLANNMLVREQKCSVLEAHNLVWLAKACDLLGEIDAAFAAIRRARSIFEERGFLTETATTLLVEGRAEYRRGKASEAVALFRRSLELYHSRGDSYQEARGQVCLGLAMLRMGDPEGLQQVTLGHELADEIGLERSLLYEGMKQDTVVSGSPSKPVR